MPSFDWIVLQTTTLARWRENSRWMGLPHITHSSKSNAPGQEISFLLDPRICTIFEVIQGMFKALRSFCGYIRKHPRLPEDEQQFINSCVGNMVRNDAFDSVWCKQDALEVRCDVSGRYG